MKTMDTQTMQEIYTNKKLRNAVATAHVCCDSAGRPKYKKALYYPIDYLVTEDQIAEAKAERRRAAEQTIKENEGNLLFIGMGMKTDKGGGIINHRFRAKFTNDARRPCFVEFSYCDTKYLPDCLYCTFWITDYETEKEAYHKSFDFKKSLPEVLRVINRGFGCSFKGVFIDNWDLPHADHVSKSPNAKKAA